MQLTAEGFNETVTVQLPEGFDVDEIPDAGKIEGDFGRYESGCALAGRALTCARTLQLEAQSIPPAQYPALRGFFEHVAEAEAAPVVLVRK